MDTCPESQQQHYHPFSTLSSNKSRIHTRTIVLLAIRPNEKGSTFERCAGRTQLLYFGDRVREWCLIFVGSRGRGAAAEDSHRSLPARLSERVVD